MRQIEKSDGAVIGALVNTQAELHFSNLLSTIRSGKVKHVDIKAGENVGLLSEVLKKGESISEQTGKAFTDLAKHVVTQMSYSEEITGEYQKEQLDEYRNALSNANQECIALLERGQFPANAENVVRATIASIVFSFIIVHYLIVCYVVVIFFVSSSCND